MINNGIADFSQTPLNSAVALDGQWRIAPYKFLSPQQSNQAEATIEVPGSWYDRRPDLFLSHQGYATYVLQLKFSNLDLGRIFALRIPQVATAYRLFLEGSELATVGTFATTPELSQPKYRRLLIPFQVNKEEMTLLVQVSNYEEAYVGGLWKASWYIGPLAAILQLREMGLAYDLFVIGILFIFGIYHLALFLLRTEDKASLAFGLFCLVVALRASVTGEQVLVATDFLSFNWHVRLEYATIYAGMAFFVWYVGILFRHEFQPVLKNIVVSISLLFLILTFLLLPLHFAVFLPLFQLLILFTGLWLLFVISRAIYHKRPGAKIFMVGFLVLLAAVLNDILVNRSGQGSFHFPLGLVIFIFSQSFIVSMINAKTFGMVKQLSEQLQQLNQQFRKFVPEDALKLLNKKDITSIALGDQNLKELTLLFADIRNFTAISEKMTPAENFNFLNSYLQQLGPIIRRNGGFIDKYLGDGFMALFPNSPDGALNAAVEIQQKIQEYNRGRQKAGYEPISIGIGLHYGLVMLGTIGEAERMEVTVISDTVNLAARIQELSRIMEAPILISELLFQKLTSPHDLSYRMLGQVHVKGKSQTVTIFEILSGRTEEQAEALALSKGIFERGIMHYLEHNYTRAIELFEKALQVCSEDKVAQLYLARCRKLAVAREKESWQISDSILV